MAEFEKPLQRYANQPAEADQTLLLQDAERQRLEEELLRSREQVRALARHLQLAREEVSTRVARQLRDEFAMVLTAIKLLLESTLRAPLDPTNSGVTRALKQTNQLIGRLRDLCYELHPVMLEELGLLPALRWHLGRYMDRSNIKVEFKHCGLERRRFEPEVEIGMYRIAQEGLTNVARYASVETVEVGMWADATALCMRIRDHGVGFDPQSPAVLTGSGLSGMRERAVMLGGWFSVESTPRGGAVLRAKLPLRTSISAQSRIAGAMAEDEL
jgi:two-component system sensor histidine kinase UhpB